MKSKIYILSILMVILLFSFDTNVVIPQNNAEIITAHRGSSGSTPENTMSSVLRAIEDGAGYAEIDVQETADGMLVLFHDASLYQKTGISKSLWQMNYSEIGDMDIGGWFSPEFAGEPIPTLEAIMDAAHHKIKLNIDLKVNGRPHHSLVENVVSLIQNKEFITNCIVTSFDRSALEYVRQLNENIRTGLIVDARSLITEDLFTADYDIVSIRGSYVNRAFMNRAAEHGKEVHVWTINSKREMNRLLKYGVNSIITDYPTALQQLFNPR